MTSTKADIVDATIYVRHNTAAADTRRVWVLDPDEVAGWPAQCRWDIVAGCDDPAEAMRRAAAMTAAKPLGRGGNAEFFADACRTVLRCLLHAAALTPDGSMREVMGWVRNFADDTPFIILREDPQAEPGWVEDLTKYTRGAAPETVASTEMSLNSVVSSLSRQRVLELVCPQPGQGFDVDAFVARGQDTIYCLSEGGADVSTAPLVTAFVDAIVSAAKRASQRQPTAPAGPDPDPGPRRGAQRRPAAGHAGTAHRRRWAWPAHVGVRAELRAATRAVGPRRRGHAVGRHLVEAAARRVHRNRRSGADIPAVRGPVGAPGQCEPAGRLVQRQPGQSAHLGGTGATRPVDEISEMPIGTALLLYRSTVREKVTLPAWWERPDAARFADSVEQARQVTGRTPAPA